MDFNRTFDGEWEFEYDSNINTSIVSNFRCQDIEYIFRIEIVYIIHIICLHFNSWITSLLIYYLWSGYGYDAYSSRKIPGNPLGHIRSSFMKIGNFLSKKDNAVNNIAQNPVLMYHEIYWI